MGFRQAAELFKGDTEAQFDAARAELIDLKETAKSRALTPEEQERYQRAQAEMRNAVKQLNDIESQLVRHDRLEAEQRGYEQVVDLMTSAAAAAETVRSTMDTLLGEIATTGTGPQQQILNRHLLALAKILAALAEISPSAVWEQH